MDHPAANPCGRHGHGRAVMEGRVFAAGVVTVATGFALLAWLFGFDAIQAMVVKYIGYPHPHMGSMGYQPQMGGGMYQQGGQW